MHDCQLIKIIHIQLIANSKWECVCVCACDKLTMPNIQNKLSSLHKTTNQRSLTLCSIFIMMHTHINARHCYCWSICKTHTPAHNLRARKSEHKISVNENAYYSNNNCKHMSDYYGVCTRFVFVYKQTNEF